MNFRSIFLILNLLFLSIKPMEELKDSSNLGQEQNPLSMEFENNLKQLKETLLKDFESTLTLDQELNNFIGNNKLIKLDKSVDIKKTYNLYLNDTIDFLPEYSFCLDLNYEIMDKTSRGLLVQNQSNITITMHIIYLKIPKLKTVFVFKHSIEDDSESSWKILTSSDFKYIGFERNEKEIFLFENPKPLKQKSFCGRIKDCFKNHEN